MVWLTIAVSLVAYLLIKSPNVRAREIVGAVVLLMGARTIIDFVYKLPMHYPYAGPIPYTEQRRSGRLIALIFSVGVVAFGAFMLFVGDA